MESSLITAYERHVIFNYLFNLVARRADTRMSHVNDMDCVPEWIIDHAELLKCDSLLGSMEWSRAHLRKVLGHRRDGGKRPRRDPIARHLRQLARAADLSGLDLALTTNGTLLASRARELKAAGLQRITVSLDSLDEAVFRQMSGEKGDVGSVLQGIEAALGRGDTSEELQARADSLDEAAGEVLRGLRGGGGGFGGFGGGGRQTGDGPQPVQRILAEANGIHQIYAPATEAERSALERAAPALEERLPVLNELVAAMADFRRALDEAGVPWTPGRPVKPLL